MRSGRHFAWTLGSALLLSVAQPASADGFFLQADAGPDTQGLVAATAQGAFNYGFNLARYDDGTSVSASITYTIPLGEVGVMKLGPSIGFQREDGAWSAPEPGLKLSLERYTPTSFGGAFALAEVSSVDNAWFLLGQLSWAQTGLGLELSRGGSDSYRETTVALSKRLPESPVSLRVGYKLSSEEVFFGFNINTF